MYIKAIFNKKPEERILDQTLKIRSGRVNPSLLACSIACVEPTKENLVIFRNRFCSGAPKLNETLDVAWEELNDIQKALLRAELGYQENGFVDLYRSYSVEVEDAKLKHLDLERVGLKRRICWLELFQTGFSSLGEPMDLFYGARNVIEERLDVRTQETLEEFMDFALKRR